MDHRQGPLRVPYAHAGRPAHLPAGPRRGRRAAARVLARGVRRRRPRPAGRRRRRRCSPAAGSPPRTPTPTASSPGSRSAPTTSTSAPARSRPRRRRSSPSEVVLRRPRHVRRPRGRDAPSSWSGSSPRTRPARSSCGCARPSEHGRTRVVAIAPYATRGLRKMDGHLVAHRARRRGGGARRAASSRASTASTATAVILVGERLATVPGALTAAAALAAKTGARLAWVPRRAGDRGAVETGCLPNLLPGGRPVADAAARVDAAAAWGVDSLPEAERPRRRRDRGRARAPASSAAWSSAASTPTTPADPAATRAAIEAAGVRGRARAARDRRDPRGRRGLPGRAGQRQGRHVRQLGGPAAPVRRRPRQPRLAARPADPGRHRRGAGPPAGLPHRRRGRARRWRRWAPGTASAPTLCRDDAPSLDPLDATAGEAGPGRPGSRCSTTARCRTATKPYRATARGPPSPASRRPCTTPSARRSPHR